MTGAEARDLIADLDRLNGLLSTNDWPHGALVDVSSERIGEEFGLSAELYRLSATAYDGAAVSLVAKIEHAVGTRRAAFAHRHATPELGMAVPMLWAAEVPNVVDPPEVGVLLLEDVRPAAQGDELVVPSRPRATDLVRLVARLHDVAVPVVDDELLPWAPSPTSDARRTSWRDSIDRAAETYPHLATDAARSRLGDLHDESSAAGDRLVQGAVTWIHRDPHLDNVLWRADGSTVLLDWSNTRVGPPFLDIAVLMFTVSFGERTVLEPDELVDEYLAARTDRTPLREHTVDGVRDALLVHVAGVFGWVGRRADGDGHDRKAKLQDGCARRLVKALHWIDQ